MNARLIARLPLLGLRLTTVMLAAGSVIFFRPSDLPAEDVESVAKSWAAVIPGATVDDVRSAAAAYVADPKSSTWATELLPAVKRAATAGRNGIADTLAQPGIGLDFVVDGERRVLKAVSLGAEAGTGGAGGTANIGTDITGSVKLSTNSDPKSRSIGSTVAYALPEAQAAFVLRSKEVVGVTRSATVKFNYKEDRDFLRAHGLSAEAMPGGSTMVRMTERVVGSLRGEEPLSPSAPRPAADPATAALHAVKETVFPNAKLIENFESVTGGGGVQVEYKIENPEGSGKYMTIGFSHSKLERLELGQQAGTGVKFSETGLEFGLGVEGGKFGQTDKSLYRVGARAAIKYSTDPESKPDPSLKYFADLIRSGQDHEAADMARRRTALLSNPAPGDETQPGSEAAKPPAPDDAWKLPATPGGIALSPSLEMPAVGNVQRVELDVAAWRIVVASDSGRFTIESLDPQTFATILRAVRQGQVPYISIGTEPSDRVGYARVTYAPALKQTRVGAILYDADVQFKGIFADFPFGDAHQLNGPGEDLIDGFPGMGGEFMRFWITNSGMRLKAAGDTLVVDRHGMTILSETTLRQRVVSDPEMDAYARKLTDRWDEVAAAVPAFGATEELALATALAFWIRQHRIAVDEQIWMLSPNYQATPDYSPAIASVGRSTGVTGGVCLTPEEKDKSQARQLLFLFSALLEEQELSAGSAWLVRAIVLTASLLGVAAILTLATGGFWLIVRGVQWRQKVRPSFVGLGRTLALAIATWAVFAALAVPLLQGDRLGWCDQLFLTDGLVLFVAPLTLFFWIRRGEERLADLNETLRKSMPATIAVACFGVTVPLWSALIAGMLATSVLALAGSVPGVALERALGALMSPGRVLSTAGPAALATRGEDGKPFTLVLPVPGSIRAVTLPPLFVPAAPPNAAESAEVVLDNPKSATSQLLPVNRLLRVRWPATMSLPPGAAHFSVDGYPPFASDRDAVRQESSDGGP